MPIDAVNAAMTPLQFARARSANRTIETSAALSSGSPRSRGHLPVANPSPPDARIPSHRLLTPVSFHWAYSRTIINGKHVAKRTPQFADTSYWSIGLNRLG
jgi:hypothetical protein